MTAQAQEGSSVYPRQNMPKRNETPRSLDKEKSADQAVDLNAPTSGLNRETVLQAAKALLSHVKKSPGLTLREIVDLGGAEVEDGAEIVSVVVVLKCPPKRACLKPRMIPLAHPLYHAGADDVCLFVKDPQRLVKDHLAERNVDGISKVMGVSKLEKRYGTHEGRRELSQLYDLFLVDDRVLPMMPRLLGNTFVRSKKMPMIIRMDRDIPKSIEKAFHSTTFCPGSGTTCTIRVAKTTFLAEQIAENVQAAVSHLAASFRNAMYAFQALYIKSETSPSLPIFFSVPTSQDFAVSAEEKLEIAAAHRKKVSKHKKRLKLNSARQARKRSGDAIVDKQGITARIPDSGVCVVDSAKAKSQNIKETTAIDSLLPGGIGDRGTKLVEDKIRDTADHGLSSSQSQRKGEVHRNSGNAITGVGSTVGGKPESHKTSSRPVGVSKKRRTSDRPLVREVGAKKARPTRDQPVRAGRQKRV